ncbi:hypothetical protein [Paenibacillus oryzisoli]|uniref:Beta/gamma crystallin 'Greek key' domain-containing protein n=1 Tax=Paenibacillus oryzisoli TaxID=1850517 RepID=A0A198AT25_9BACL|nr:hypothetical protein [Paenibacillus oryzisoli]OAS24008.1 hypothetical protein A8708_14865 [Paenibacillus oryzisoli]
MPVYAKPIYPRLTVYSEKYYQGGSAILSGNIGIPNFDLPLGGMESLRFFSTNPNSTLVLFSLTRFRGDFRVFHGVRNVSDFDNIINGNDANSLISTNKYLTLRQIRAIRDSGRLPSGYRRI